MDGGGIFHLHVSHHDDVGQQVRFIRNLWAQALKNALADATCTARTDIRRLERDRARDFLLSPRYREDRDWFDMALGYDAGTVQKMGETLRENGWQVTDEGGERAKLRIND